MPTYPVITADTATNTQSRYQQLREVLTKFYAVTGNEVVLEDNADDFPKLEKRLWEAVGSLALFIDPSQPVIVAAPADGDTYRIVAYATRAGKITNLRKARTASGTMTVAVKINGTAVTGLSAVSVTTSPVNTAATAANTFAVGDEIAIVVTAASSPTFFSCVVEMTNGTQ